MRDGCHNCKFEPLEASNRPCSKCEWAEGKGYSKWKRANNKKERLSAFDLVNTERNRQDAKWGEQNHAPQLWTGILGEEFGEYCQAVNETVFNNGEKAKLKGGYDNMLTELTHVAAVAVGAIESLMRARQRGDI